MNLTLPTTFALLTFFLVACPAAETPRTGSIPEPAPEQAITEEGIITFVETSGATPEGTFQSGIGAFSTVPEVPVSNYNRAPGDICIVSSPFDEPPPTEEPEVTSLDAGAEITATSGGATYAVLTRTEFDGTFTYSNDPNQNLPPLPQTAVSVTVPGAAFPAFTADAPVAGAALSFTSPADPGAISPESTFSWTPAPVANASTSVSFLAQQSLDAMTSVSVSCSLVDDGTFSFSAETRADMELKGFILGELVQAGRTTSRTHFQGNAALVISITRDAYVDSEGTLGSAEAR